MGFLCRVAGLSLRDKGAALLHQSKAAEVVWTTDRDPPERLPCGGFPGMTNLEETLRRMLNLHLIWPGNASGK